MHTAQHLVSHCLSGDLALGRTIVLVTHHISLCLPYASYLVELQKGAILYQGNISELEEKGHLSHVIKTEDELFPSTDSPPETLLHAHNESAPPQRREPTTDGKLVEAEARAEGRVSLRSYVTYIKASGVIAWSLTLAIMTLIRAINIGNQVNKLFAISLFRCLIRIGKHQFFLSTWSQAYETGRPVEELLGNKTSFPWSNLPPPSVNVKPWLLIYLYISIAGAFATLSYITLGYYTSLQASRSLFLALLRRLTRAPARFFDVTPIGRILNRFTNDISTIDNALQSSVRNCLTGVLTFFASFAVMLFIVPAFTPFSIVIAWLYIRLAPPYIRASRDLRRLESVSLSPAFAGFDELLRGIIHVRAFGMETRYQDTFYKRVSFICCMPIARSQVIIGRYLPIFRPRLRTSHACFVVLILILTVLSSFSG